MSNIEKYTRHLPAASKLDLVKYLFEQDSNGYDAIELVISINQNGVNIKELSAYLDFIYRIDAQLSEIGYATYVQLPHLQIEIEEVRIGSWEIVIEKYLHTVDANRLAVIFFALKFLPNIIRTTFDGIYRVYEILDKREDYLEKKRKKRST